MFKHLHKTPSTLTLYIDGEAVVAQSGDSVAAAVLKHCGHTYRTSALSTAARAPYCMIGVCFECLIEIDGVANQQACMIPVHEGMQVRRQLAQQASQAS